MSVAPICSRFVGEVMPFCRLGDACLERELDCVAGPNSKRRRGRLPPRGALLPVSGLWRAVENRFDSTFLRNSANFQRDSQYHSLWVMIFDTHCGRSEGMRGLPLLRF